MSNGRPRGVTRLVGSLVNPMIGAVDVDSVIESVDLDEVLARVALDAVLDRLDIDRLLARIDVDALIQRIDIDALIQRVDVTGLVQQANVASIMGSSAGSIATSSIDLARRQVRRLDRGADVIVGKVVRRGTDLESEPRPGTTAGPISRLLAYVIDVAAISTLFAVIVFVCTYLIGLFLQRTVQANDAGWWWASALLVFAFIYYWATIALVGRTVGKAVLGTRVLARDGTQLGPGPAFTRALVFPFSFILGLGFIPMVTERQHRALHDHAAGCVVVYDVRPKPE